MRKVMNEHNILVVYFILLWLVFVPFSRLFKNNIVLEPQELYVKEENSIKINVIEENGVKINVVEENSMKINDKSRHEWKL